MPRESRKTGQVVNRSELARILGVAPTTIDNWRESGMPVRRQGKQDVFNTREVIDWQAARERKQEPRQRTDGEEELEPGQISTLEAIRRKEQALSELRRLEVDQLRGELIRKVEVVNAVVKIATVFREAVERIVMQGAGEIHSARDEWEARDVARRITDPILEDASKSLSAIAGSGEPDGSGDQADSSDPSFRMGGSTSAPIH